MAEYVLLIILILSFASSLCEIKQKNSCTAVLTCGGQPENVSMVIEGLQGLQGPQGPTGLRGPMGPRGWTGPAGRSGFIERPPSFYAQLPRLFLTKNSNSILRPWTLSDSFNPPDVTSYFSPETGIFTVPKSGLYHFFLTIAVSQARAFVYLTKNEQKICTIWIESLASESNFTFAWGWASNSIDCLISCQIDDQISAMAIYRREENFHTQIYGYSYTVFSGYMIVEN